MIFYGNNIAMIPADNTTGKTKQKTVFMDGEFKVESLSLTIKDMRSVIEVKTHTHTIPKCNRVIPNYGGKFIKQFQLKSNL